ncbi:hypothetical protein [Rhodococcus maanshanensis]|nr:hypothetical protein [Rhodococcus maanshanensis]
MAVQVDLSAACWADGIAVYEARPIVRTSPRWGRRMTDKRRETIVATNTRRAIARDPMRKGVDRWVL